MSGHPAVASARGLPGNLTGAGWGERPHIEGQHSGDRTDRLTDRRVDRRWW